MKEFTGGRSVLGPGTLYGTIKRMLEAELIEDLDSPGGDEDDPRRRYYRITDLGRRALELETEGLASLVGTAHAPTRAETHMSTERPRLSRAAAALSGRIPAAVRRRDAGDVRRAP